MLYAYIALKLPYRWDADGTDVDMGFTIRLLLSKISSANLIYYSLIINNLVIYDKFIAPLWLGTVKLVNETILCAGSDYTSQII